MFRPAAILTGAFLVAASAAPQPRAAAPAHFTIILEHSAATWSAECMTGCSTPWKASFTCASARSCGARVDALGIITLDNHRALDPKFSFTLHGTPDGITAKRLNGTAWRTLEWGCGFTPCRARITELDVETLPPPS
ncbi:MAG TPA: hypothetical protein VGM20_10010 [Gemmatimonadales bacterium]|jgi:hypothetical protein